MPSRACSAWISSNVEKFISEESPEESMATITVSVPDKLIKRFPEVNWSGILRKAVEEKTGKLEKLERLKKEFEAEREMTDWAVKLQRASRRGRLEALKEKGLL